MKRTIEPFGEGGVRLRLLAEADLEMTLGWRNRDDVRIWFKTSQIIMPEHHRAWYSRYSTRDDDFVFVVEAEGRPIGQASVYEIDWSRAIGEVGRFLVAPEAQGRGYISVACAELVRCCAETLNLKYVFLEVKADNVRALKVYAHTGFREEARADGMIRMGRVLNLESAVGKV